MGLTHKIKYLKREIETNKAVIEELKEEVKRKNQDHEAVVTAIQQKDQTMTEYQNKTKGASEHWK